jgi:hypothetical protein
LEARWPEFSYRIEAGLMEIQGNPGTESLQGLQPALIILGFYLKKGGKPFNQENAVRSNIVKLNFGYCKEIGRK